MRGVSSAVILELTWPSALVDQRKRKIMSKESRRLLAYS
jgi:hypothetical protein